MTNDMKLIDELGAAGVHVGAKKSLRHPSTRDQVFGLKGDREIIDLGKTEDQIKAASEFLMNLSKEGKTILLVGNKNEAQSAVVSASEKLGMPYVINRWIGGTLTNFTEIKKRVARLKELQEMKEKGSISIYTKKEQVKLNFELEKLLNKFEGIVDMAELPKALYVVDPGFDSIAVDEAIQMGIPVVSLMNSDCDMSKVTYPVVANDGSQASIEKITNILSDAYLAGKKLAK